MTNKKAKGRVGSIVAIISGTKSEDDNRLVEKSRKEGEQYIPIILKNGDTRKQLIARSRYLLFKHHSKWTDSQKERAEVLFEEYPKIQQAYKLTMEL